MCCILNSESERTIADEDIAKCTGGDDSFYSKHSNVVIINPDSMLLLLLALLLLSHAGPHSTYKVYAHKCYSRSEEKRSEDRHRRSYCCMHRRHNGATATARNESTGVNCNNHNSKRKNRVPAGWSAGVANSGALIFLIPKRSVLREPSRCRHPPQKN